MSRNPCGALILLTCCALAAPAQDASLLLSPTQGRPVFVKPGSALELVALVTDVDASLTPQVTLVSRSFPPHRHPLETPADASAKLLAGAPQYLQIPEDIPQQTYDLEVRFGRVELVGRHCVAVGEVGRRVRIVHLSDMNVGDLGAPDFDQRLIDEINLVSPTLVIATGDYLDASASEPEAGWSRLSEFLAKLDAPTLMACGDHDDLEHYSRIAAPSAIGTVEVGPYRGIVLMDHSRHAIEQDEQQIAWAEHLLRDPNSLFIVSHNESPGLARHWLNNGQFERRLGPGGVLVWFTGGHRDWDPAEFRRRDVAAASTVFVRTHQSSTASLEGAAGVSHYRIVDLVDARVEIPRERTAVQAAPPSIPVGRINTVFHTRNDGLSGRVAFSVTNNLPYRVDRLSVRVLVQRSDAQPPWCRGAELAQVVSFGRIWECRVTFDLADKSSRRVVVGTGPKPADDSIRVEFDLPAVVELESRVTDEGVAYLSSALEPLIFISNSGRQPIEVMPRIRLDGSTIAYRPIDGDASFAMAYRLRLKRDEIVPIQLDLSALRVRPGRRELQVYFTHRSAWAPFTTPLEIVSKPLPGPLAASSD